MWSWEFTDHCEWVSLPLAWNGLGSRQTKRFHCTGVEIWGIWLLWLLCAIILQYKGLVGVKWQWDFAQKAKPESPDPHTMVNQALEPVGLDVCVMWVPARREWREGQDDSPDKRNCVRSTVTPCLCVWHLPIHKRGFLGVIRGLCTTETVSFSRNFSIDSNYTLWSVNSQSATCFCCLMNK